MPQAIIPAIGVFASTAITAKIAITGIAFSKIMLLATVAAGLTLVQGLLTQQPNINSGGSNTIQKKEPIQHWRFMYGEGRISGALTFIAVSPDGTLRNSDASKANEILHFIITMLCHPCQDVIMVQANEEVMYMKASTQWNGLTGTDGKDIDQNGYPFGKKYFPKNDPQTPTQPSPPINDASPNFRCRVSLGASGETVFPYWRRTGSKNTKGFVTAGFIEMNADNVEWNNSETRTLKDKQIGHTKAYIQFKFQPDLYKNGVPNMSFWVIGKNDILDTRTSTTGYTNNPALCIYDYMTTTHEEGGMGVLTDDIDTTSFNVAANTCEEMVDVTNIRFDISDTGHDTSSDEIIIQIKGKDRILLQTGDKVQIQDSGGASPAGTAPGGLTKADDTSPETEYYVIVTHPVAENEEDSSFDSETASWRVQLASTYKNALDRVPISISTTTSSAVDLVKVAEPRYTLNGIVETERKPADILSEMLSSMDGRLYHSGGKWRIIAGEYLTPYTTTFDESNIIGPVTVKTKMSRTERFNCVKGVFVNPNYYGQPADYPHVENTTYIAQDDPTNNQKIFTEFNLPFTSRPTMAQRLAKIHLEKSRQEIVVEATFDMNAFPVKVGDNIKLNNTRFGWTEKVFAVIEWEFTQEAGDNDAPVFAIRMLLQEIASTMWDWDLGDQNDEDDAPNTNMGDVTSVPEVTGLTCAEEKYTTNTSAGTKSRIKVDWVAPRDGYVSLYRVEYKLASDSDWVINETTPALTSNINDLAVGIYDVKVIAINNFQFESDGVECEVEIFGSDPPGDVQNVQCNIESGILTITWDLSTDNDVLNGGNVIIRYDDNTSSPDWSQSTSYAEAAGNATSIPVAPITGSYLLKFRDADGKYSLNATSCTVTQPASTEGSPDYSFLESPTFTGTKTNCEVVDSTLRIELDEAVSPTVGVKSSATYNFNTSINFGGSVAKRFTRVLGSTGVLEFDTIDERLDNIDDWEQFDGISGNEVDCIVYIRYQTDDPAASPTPSFSAWEKLTVNNITAWYVEFKAELSTSDSQANIHIDTLGVNIEEQL